MKQPFHQYLLTGIAIGAMISHSAWAQTPPPSGMPMLPPVAPGGPTAPVTPPTSAAMGTPPAMSPAPVNPSMAGELPAIPGEKPAEPLSEAPVAVSNSQQFSYGDETMPSLLYTQGQITNLKRAIEAFEKIRPDQGNNELTVVETAPVAPVKIDEPASYPVYYLSSIAYHVANDWTVWVNNTRITPKTNEGELKVLAVQPDRVSFSWTPPYIKALAGRINDKTMAPSDKVAHRTVNPNSANLDRQNGTVTFALRPNQSFVAGYFQVFEGHVGAPAMPAVDTSHPALPPGLSPQDAEAITGLLGTPNTPPPPPTPEDKDRSTMEGLISRQKQITPKFPTQ